MNDIIKETRRPKPSRETKQSRTKKVKIVQDVETSPMLAEVAPTTEIEITPTSPTDQEAILAIYQDILHRPPDIGGLRYYLAQLKKGWTLDTVREKLENSPERKKLLKAEAEGQKPTVE